MRYFVYILECCDNTLYTGITTDIERRLDEHNSGTGAKYTRSRTPVRIAYVEEQPNRSSASKREREIKLLSRKSKLALIESNPYS